VARPRTPIGAHGTIHVTLIAEKAKGRPAVYEARTRVRMGNGRTRRPRRRGASETKAINALKEHITGLKNEATGKKGFSGDTRFGYIADKWLADLERKVNLGLRAPKTLYDYRDTVNNYIRDAMYELSASEVSVTCCDERIKTVHDDVGFATAKRLKVVLGGICGYGVRHGAVFAGAEGINPVKQVDTVERGGKKKAITVLEPAQRTDFMTKLRTYTAGKGDVSQLGPRARAWTDLPDIAEGMLATGVRISEILAVVGEGVDLKTRRVVVDHHLVRIAGQGIVRVPERKGDGSALILVVPTWSVEMWRRRKLESGGGVLFPAWNGALVDPSNVGKRFRAACDAIGYEDVSSHVFRHTVGTHLGDADIVSTAIGDQLGNSAKVVEEHYRRKRVANAGTADSLESLFDQVEG
jgi:integrase